MMMVLPTPSEQHTNKLPILPYITGEQSKQRQFNNHVFLVLHSCCFCSDLTTAKSHPHMQTNTKANSLHLKN